LKNIYQRLDAIRQDIAYLQKDATVTGYKAITHDFVTSELRPKMIKHGVVTIPRQISGELKDTTKTTGKGIPYTNYVGMYEFDFVNIDEPTDFVTVRVGAMSEDTADKGPGGAISYAMKYAFLKIFNIETGDKEESRQAQKPNHITEDQAIEINDLIKETSANLEAFLKVAKAKSVEEITSDKYEMLIKQLHIKRDKMREPGE